MPNQVFYKMSASTKAKASGLITWIRSEVQSQGSFEFNCASWIRKHRNSAIWDTELKQFRFFHNNIERLKAHMLEVHNIRIETAECGHKYIATPN